MPMFLTAELLANVAVHRLHASVTRLLATHLEAVLTAEPQTMMPFPCLAAAPVQLLTRAIPSELRPRAVDIDSRAHTQ